MASDVSQSFERTYAEADKYTQMSTYFMLKLKAMFDKVVAMVFDVYYALASMMDMLNVAMKGPDLMMGAFYLVLIILSIIAAVFPKFHDIYREAGLHDSYGYLDDQNGQTFEQTLNRAWHGKARIIQIATWNDFGEGTIIEPTQEFGYRYLESL